MMWGQDAWIRLKRNAYGAYSSAEWCTLAPHISANGGRNMKRERNREKHDYNKVDANEKYATIRSKEYYGIFVRNDRVHVDTKRFKKELEDLNAMEFWKDGMNANRSTPYLIPKKKHRDEYYVNICRDIVSKLSSDWRTEFLPAIAAIKSPEDVGRMAATDAIAYRLDDGAMEEAQLIGLRASLDRVSKYHDVITTLYCSYLQRIASECDRALALVFRKRGKVSDSFGFKELRDHLDEIEGKDESKDLYGIEGYPSFEAIRKLDNFLKHHTVHSYNAVKKFCPQYLIDKNKKFANGMYAPNWLRLPENFIEQTLQELEKFFIDFCHVYFGESHEEAEWNYDDYFYRAYREIRNTDVYLGICDKWGNSLVG